MLAEATLKNRRMVSSKIFETPAVFDSKAEALKVLDNIRKSHPSSLGWEEIGDGGYVVLCSNGKWRAVRCHAKYE